MSMMNATLVTFISFAQIVEVYEQMNMVNASVYRGHEQWRHKDSCVHSNSATCIKMNDQKLPTWKSIWTVLYMLYGLATGLA